MKHLKNSSQTGKKITVVFTVVIFMFLVVSNVQAQFSISGPALVCSSGSQFTIQNYNNETLVWSCSSNLTLTSTQGQNPATFTANGNGNGYISAQITCCGVPQYLQPFVVWVGAPINEGVSAESGPVGYAGGQSSFAVWPGPNHISEPVATWYSNPDADLIQDADCFAIFSWDYSGHYYISASLSNSCGESSREYLLYEGPYSGYTLGFEVLDE
jgi:hypothetical protein